MRTPAKLWLPILSTAAIFAFTATRATALPDDLPDAPALLSTDAPPPPAQTMPVRSASGALHEPTREITWRNLPRSFGRDQKDIWLGFPRGLATGHHWIPLLSVAGGTAALIYADPHIARYFRNHATNLDDFNDVFDPLISTGEVIAVPASLMAAGYIRHDPYQVDTALSASLAYGDSAIVDLAVKAVTRRERPSDVAPAGTFTGTFFNGSKSPLKGSSFPSGHAAAAFSVATVVANRYGNHKWVPWTVYTMATVISLSRITTNAHFSSDVLLGGAIGYTVAKYQVLRPQ